MKAQDAVTQSLMTRLRTETREQHRALESIPFSQAITAGALPRYRYLGQLRALHTIHRKLESFLSKSRHPAVSKVWHDGLAKTPLLAKDILYFDKEHNAVDLNVARASRRFTKRIELVSKTAPAAMLGYLYVLEGSTLGSTILRKKIEESFGLSSESGMAYYNVYGNKVRTHWNEFKATMEELPLTTREQELVIQGARDGFRHIGGVLAALSSELPPFRP